ncbi:MAG: Gfo/Idh/MocA family oxidoreductase [Gemmatimonadota bacterium]|nr:Gfo/Idh/MocA family oxidoreductase [Gemmatimonadota bacterium]
MKTPIRAGIAGTGFAAEFHADALRRCHDAEISMVCGIEGLDEFCDRWEVERRTDDFTELARDSQVDVVIVCTPTFVHRPVVEAAAAAGKQIICEKPLATTLEDARAMVAAASDAGVKLMYAEDWCFSPILKRAEEIVAEGALGKLLYVKAKEVHSGSHSEYAKKLEYCGGGALFHIGCHPINWVRHLVGKEVVEVLGKTTGGGSSNMVHKDYEGEDWGVAIFTFEDGERGFVEGNYITIGGMDDTVEIYGTKGAMKVELTLGSPIHVYSREGYKYSVEKADNQLGWTRPAVDELWQLGYPPEIEYFIGCVRDNKEPMMGAGGADGLASMEVAFAAYESNATGKAIKMSDFRAGR